jgi:hypothetical protein
MIVPPLANIYLRPNIETVQAKQHRKFHGDVGCRESIHQNAGHGKGTNERASAAGG